MSGNLEHLIARNSFCLSALFQVLSIEEKVIYLQSFAANVGLLGISLTALNHYGDK